MALYSQTAAAHFIRMDRERLDNWCERGILGLVLAILVFAPLATGAVRAQDFLVVEALTVGVLGLWAARLWLNERPQFLWPPVCWVVLAFTAYAIGRYCTADIEYVARQELIRVLVYAALFFALLNNLHRQESVQVIAHTLIFLGMAISVYAAVQYLSGSNRVWTFISPYRGRAGGTYICPNHLAGLLGMLLPLALAYTIVGRGKALMRVLTGYAALVMGFGIAVTISRGGWLASAGALVVFFGLLLLRRHFRLPMLVVALVIAAAGAVFFSRTTFLQERFKKAFPEGKAEKVEDIRFELWRPAVQMWREHVWFGVGPAHFNQVFPEYRPQTIQISADYVHNDYLNTLVDWGTAGAALVAGALVVLGFGVGKTWRHVRSSARDLGSNLSNKFAFVLGASVGLCAILFHSVVDFNMHIPANAIVAVSLMALLSSHLRFATDGHWVKARLGFKLPATLVLLAGGIYLGAQTARGFAEHRSLARAGLAPFGSPEQIAALERAFAIEPKNSETASRLGEAFRVQSWEGGLNYAALAQRAMDWYARGMKLNPHDPYLPLRYGMCLDWLDRQAEAAAYFVQAGRLDPNGFFTATHIGWHYVQTGNYAAAREWFERSVRLEWTRNPTAPAYLEIANRKLAEGAAARNPIPETPR